MGKRQAAALVELRVSSMLMDVSIASAFVGRRSFLLWRKRIQMSTRVDEWGALVNKSMKMFSGGG